MDLSVIPTEHESVVTVTGEVSAPDVPEFRRRLVEVLDAHLKDVVIDMRQVVHVDAGLFVALQQARSRAKTHRCRLVVVDPADGVTARGLQQRGMHQRIPFYDDCDAAVAALAGIRAAREKLTVAFSGSVSS